MHLNGIEMFIPSKNYQEASTEDPPRPSHPIPLVLGAMWELP
jgi:hypothetical protein